MAPTSFKTGRETSLLLQIESNPARLGRVCSDYFLLTVYEYEVHYTKYKVQTCTVIIHSKSMDQPGEVANLVRGQLNREKGFFPVPVRA